MKKIFLALVFCTWFGAQPAIAGDAAIYLVRHAEKQQDSDPGLTKEGVARAGALAERLGDIELAKVYSTDFNRTRQTAEPTARQKGLGVSLYDPRAFREFADALKAEFLAQDKSILVVGHSNTTPYLATLLTGVEHAMLNEDQYDHIYVVRQAEDGSLKATIEYFNP